MISAKLRLENPPIEDKNARGEHFLPEDYVTSVLPGHGPSKKTLKPQAVPSVFSFVTPAKRRKTSEARIARTEQRVMVAQLLSTCSSSSNISLESQPRTTDEYIQCGSFYHRTVFVCLTVITI